jgi:hypothetical protein
MRSRLPHFNHRVATHSLQHEPNPRTGANTPVEVSQWLRDKVRTRSPDKVAARRAVASSSNRMTHKRSLGSRVVALHSPTTQSRAAGNMDTIRARSRALRDCDSHEEDACPLAHPLFLLFDPTMRSRLRFLHILSPFLLLPCVHVSQGPDHSKTQLRRRHRPQIRLIHSGTVQSAAEPCASSNGSLPRNSCFARRLNRTGAQHEVLLTSSVTARASARTQIPCLIWSGLLGWLFLLPSTASLSCFTQPSHRRSRTSYPTRPVPDTSPPAQTDSKYIAFHKVHSLP